MDGNTLYALRSETFDIENPEVYIEVVPNDVKSHFDIFAKSESAKQMTDLIDVSASGSKISVHVRRKRGGLMQFFSGDFALVRN